MVNVFFHILIFPGFLFVVAFGLAAEYVDRKLCARFQNRMGPPWYQPVADFIKLVAKEDVIPRNADPGIFKFMPLIAMTSIVTAFFYIPIWSDKALFFFDGVAPQIVPQDRPCQGLNSFRTENLSAGNNPLNPVV